MPRALEAEKLVLVLTTSTSRTGVKKEVLVLKCVPCIHYLIQFKKNANETQIQALIDSKSEINAIHLTFVKELGLPIRPMDVGAQKINSIMLDTYGMVVAAFLVRNKPYRVKFFEKTFLVTNVSPEIVLGMLFLILSGADIDFLDWKLW